MVLHVSRGRFSPNQHVGFANRTENKIRLIGVILITIIFDEITFSGLDWRGCALVLHPVGSGRPHGLLYATNAQGRL